MLPTITVSRRFSSKLECLHLLIFEKWWVHDMIFGKFINLLICWGSIENLESVRFPRMTTEVLASSDCEFSSRHGRPIGVIFLPSACLRSHHHFASRERSRKRLIDRKCGKIVGQITISIFSSENHSAIWIRQRQISASPYLPLTSQVWTGALQIVLQPSFNLI